MVWHVPQGAPPRGLSVPYTDPVRVSLDIPDAFVQQLVEQDKDPSRAALEALAIDAYRMERITGFQIRKLLGIPDRYELDGFLKKHGVMLEYTIEDFERDRKTADELWKRRQAENQAPTRS